jgi:integrase
MFSAVMTHRILSLHPAIVSRKLFLMKVANESTTAGADSIPKTQRDPHLSTDGKWRSFPKVPNLLQYVISGTYYARCKVSGKPIRASLDTDVFTVAKTRLPDKIKELRKPKVEVGTFAEGQLLFEQQTKCDHTLAELSKVYRLRCVNSLLRSWPGLDSLKASAITEADCRAWAARYAEKYAGQFFNNTLNVFRQVLTLAGLGRDNNPAFKIKRLGIRPKMLELPTSDEFERLLQVIETSGAAQAKDCADLVRFLSFTGCRVAEMKQACWRDVDWQRNEITIHCVKRRATSNASATRIVPLIPALKQLLQRLRQDQQPADRICNVAECQGALTRGCKLVGCSRLTHHSLRHLFATRCVESGIDIPTVARWLGHSDGGMLALKIYGHLRREHSQSMAAKVTFGAAIEPENVAQIPNTTRVVFGKS